MVKVTPLSQKVLGSSQPLCMQGKGLPRLFLPQTPLTWELPALGLSFSVYCETKEEEKDVIYLLIYYHFTSSCLFNVSLNAYLLSAFKCLARKEHLAKI